MIREKINMDVFQNLGGLLEWLKSHDCHTFTPLKEYPLIETYTFSHDDIKGMTESINICDVCIFKIYPGCSIDRFNDGFFCSVLHMNQYDNMIPIRQSTYTMLETHALRHIRLGDSIQVAHLTNNVSAYFTQNIAPKSIYGINNTSNDPIYLLKISFSQHPLFCTPLHQQSSPKDIELQISPMFEKEECNEAIKIAKMGNRMHPISKMGIGKKQTDVRKCKQIILPDKLPIVQRMREKIANHIGVPVENQEPFVVVRYDQGDYFKPHLDSSGNMEFRKHIGNRTHTVFVYLNDSREYEGGQTYFVTKNLLISSNCGYCTQFRNIDAEGRILRNSVHAALTITRGVKWVAVVNICEFPYYDYSMIVKSHCQAQREAACGAVSFVDTKCSNEKNIRAMPIFRLLRYLYCHVDAQTDIIDKYTTIEPKLNTSDVTLIIVMNPPVKGGKIVFPHLNLDIEPEMGRIILVKNTFIHAIHHHLNVQEGQLILRTFNFYGKMKHLSTISSKM